MALSRFRESQEIIRLPHGVLRSLLTQAQIPPIDEGRNKKLQLHLGHVLAQARARTFREDNEGIFHLLGTATGLDPTFWEKVVGRWIDLWVALDHSALDGNHRLEK